MSAPSPALTGLSATQLALWFGQQQTPGSPVYQCAERIDVHGDFDVAVFAPVLAHCLSQIPALNARYVSGAEGPERLADQREHRLRVVDARGEGDPEQRCRTLTAELMAAAPTGEISGPLLSDQVLVRIADDHHVWVQRIHHIAVDGYSFAALLRWVAACYTARLAGTDLPEPPFAEPSPAAGETGDDAGFWRDYCAGEPEPPSLTTAGHAVGVRRAHRAARQLPARTLPEGRGWAETAMAAAALYTAALSAEREVALGMPWANRALGRRPTIEPAVNILPLRITVAPTDTVHTLIDAVDAEIRQVRPHSGYRAELVRREVGAVGNDNALYGPVVNIKFFTPELTLGDAGGHITNIAMGPVDDITFTASPQPDGGLVLEVEGNPDRYSSSVTDQHARQLISLIDALATVDPQTRLGSLPIVDDAAARTQIEEFNHTAAPLPATTLTALLAESALRHAERPALSWTGRTLTYTELFRAVESLAQVLRGLGAGPDAVVALRLDRSPETVVAILATIMAGAAYLPIDPELPDERIASIIDDARPVAELTPGGDGAENPWRWEDLALEVTPRFTREPAAGASPAPHDGAYIIFTSGSTGKPKGVLIEHLAIVNRLRWMDETFRLAPDDIVMQKTPYSFDVSVWEFFWPMLTGAQLSLASPGAHRDTARLVREIVDQRITVCHFVPSALAAFLTEPQARAITGLRLVVCSGEALQPETLRTAEAILGRGVVANLYGPTEAAVDITWWRPDAQWDGQSVPIGLPVSNSAVYVLDDALRPQAPGNAGELYLAGVQLARGYLRRPGLTATRFVADPFTPGQRMYATGDLARRRADGNIDYIGRLDDQVKIRGRRIELGEIASQLSAAPDVDRAVVVVRGDGTSAMLVGYAVPEDGKTLDAAALRSHLAQTLASYMVPDAVEILDALPMTRNGKLDRKRLPEPVLGAREIIAPASPLEMTLTEVFAEILGRDEVSSTDSFFDLGGNSLSATRLAARAGEVSGREVAVSDVFAAPSVAALAARLSGDDSVDPFGRLLTLRTGDPDSTDAPLFCVHPAGGLGWCYSGLLAPLRPGAAVYALQADGLHGEALPQSLSEVADRYLAAIDEVAPDGPIRLLGWSVGGVIAHEMAAAASARGRTVERLCLLDAYPSELWADQPAPSDAEVRRAFLIMAGIDDVPLDSDEELLAALRGAHTAFGGLAPQQVRAIAGIVAHFATLMRTHRSSVYPGDALLFRAARDSQDFLKPQAWEPLLGGGLTRIDLDTNHPGMVRAENLARIAQRIDGTDS